MIKKTAEDFAKEQKEISVSEFFEKNKHLLGFDNPTKALLMAVKEAVDNSLDATEEAGILPDIGVRIKQTGEDKHRVSIQDNGPGIVKQHIPNIFGKLLYGSKFHRLRQSRGQQGIGISAVLLYSQLTTGKSTKVWSRIGKDKPMNYYELLMNTMKNEPQIIKEELVDNGFENGTKVQLELLGRYRKTQSVGDYIKQTSIANPFAKISYTGPDGVRKTFPRSVNELPTPPREIKIHPYGVEFGVLLRMLGRTKTKTIQAFLTNEFSSIGATSAKEICKVAKLKPNEKPGSLERESIEKLIRGMQKVKVQRPPLDCLSPIGDIEFEKSLRKEYPDAEFIATGVREPSVYKGNPFQIEVGIVYGKKQDKIDDDDEDVIEDRNQIKIMRFANRVPLLYQAGACATIESIKTTAWKRYGLTQSGNNIPYGPMILVIHMCSVWVPFISESKEAIAPYPEIVKEMRLAIQDTGRKLSRYLSGKRRAGEQQRRIQIFERYSSEVATAVSVLTEKDKKMIEKKMQDLVKSRSKSKETGEKNENQE
ncbi:DNA topoisomerase VI subunit B [Candidatus Aenigmatarchaeota archaeon]